jgi:two-component system, OmpR family, response regulator MprA
MSYVLVIDDQPAIRGIVQTALEEDGTFQASGVSTGEEALARFDSAAPDLIVLDLVMPGMHGLELAAHASARGIPVVLMTGEPSMSATLEGLACPHLHKPFRMDQLLAEARAACAGPAANISAVRLALQRLLASGDASDAMLQRVRAILAQARG